MVPRGLKMEINNTVFEGNSGFEGGAIFLEANHCMTPDPREHAGIQYTVPERSRVTLHRTIFRENMAFGFDVSKPPGLV